MRIALAVAFPALLAAAGCGPGGAIEARLHADGVRPQPGVVLFICDGFGANVVEQGCREGWLPNIQKRFVTGGTCVNRATTAIPAITYGAIATFLTGTGPGAHTVVGNRWFDPDRAFFRSYLTIEDYRDINFDCVMPTVYELIQPRITLNIQTAQSRGVTHNIANWATSGVMWFFGDYTAVDKLTASSVSKVAAWANAHRQWPALLTCYFPGADTIGHLFGPSSEEYRAAAIHLDHQIGRVCDWLDSRGLLTTTNLILISDHGMIDVHSAGHIDLMQLVRDRWGRRATDRTLQEGPEAWRRAYFDGFDTVVAYQNGRGAFLYFRSPNGWLEPTEPEDVLPILEAPPAEFQLWNIPGVDLVTYLTGHDAAVIRSERGMARILRRTGPMGPEYAYQPAPDDVLGYLEDADLAAFVAAGYHTPHDWLRAAAEQEWPEVVPDIVPLLHVHRAGQVVVFAEPGYSFTRERGGHGGVRRAEMLVPFMLAGPGIPAGGQIDVARSVDLVPTILDLLRLDRNEFEWLEGVSLLRETAGQASATAGHGQP